MSYKTIWCSTFIFILGIVSLALTQKLPASLLMDVVVSGLAIFVGALVITVASL